LKIGHAVLEKTTFVPFGYHGNQDSAYNLFP